MINVYSDFPDYFSNVLNQFKFINISEVDNNSNSKVVLIKNKNFKFLPNFQKHIVITLFESNLSDFECVDCSKETIIYFIEYANKLLNNKNLTEFKEKIIDELPFIEEIEQKTFFSKEIKENNEFNGIYINNILIKDGYLNFFSSFDILISIYNNNFNGELEIFENKSLIFKFSFFNGLIVDIVTNIETNNFVYFLKNSGYINSIDNYLKLISITEIINYLISKNIIFSIEATNILKDYYVFLIKKYLVLNDGMFKINYKNIQNKSPLFDSDKKIFLNLIKFYKTNKEIENNQTFKLLIKEKYYNTFIDKIINFVEKNFTYQNIIPNFENELNSDIKNALFILNLLKIIEFNNIEKNIFVSTNVIENIEGKIDIWLKRIKKDNYFKLLSVESSDSFDVIKEKYENIKKMFHSFLASETIREKYLNEIEEILFNIENGYLILSNESLKKSYFNNILEE